MHGPAAPQGSPAMQRRPNHGHPEDSGSLPRHAFLVEGKLPQVHMGAKTELSASKNAMAVEPDLLDSDSVWARGGHHRCVDSFVPNVLVPRVMAVGAVAEGLAVNGRDKGLPRAASLAPELYGIVPDSLPLPPPRGCQIYRPDNVES